MKDSKKCFTSFDERNVFQIFLIILRVKIKDRKMYLVNSLNFVM